MIPCYMVCCVKISDTKDATIIHEISLNNKTMKTRSNSEKTITKCGNGIKQAARWAARMFGYKAENKYARGVWYVFATAAAVVTLYVAIALTLVIIQEVDRHMLDRQSKREANDPTFLHNYRNTYVSPYVVHHDGSPNYLYNMRTGRRTLTGINWIAKPSDGDSLACFCAGYDHERKRGYFNVFTGEPVIPAQYDKAWIFSDGLACVYEKGMLHFIDHDGKKVMDKEFPYGIRNDDYCFHDGLCIMYDENGRFGLIDKQGEWVVEPQYYEIEYDTKGFWLVRDCDWNYGLFDAKGQMLLPVEYGNITVHHDDSCIFTRHLNHVNQVLDFECNVLNSCNYMSVEMLEYNNGKYDENGDLKTYPANCMEYFTTELYCGLMDKQGNIITPPIYSRIEAISANRYHCDWAYGSVILDDKGREVGEKL